MTKTVFVIGMDDFNRDKLDLVEARSDLEFRPLFDLEYVRERQTGDAEELLERAKRILDDHAAAEGASVDGVIAYWDFPVQTMVPILRDHCGLPTPPLESVLCFEHKAWSRLVQRRVVHDHVPEFRWFDPFEDPGAAIDLDPPFWIKPVKATNSQLGFHVADDRDLEVALETIRAEIGRYGHWFDQFLAGVDLPEPIEGVGGTHCVAEELLEGSQHTLSGWAQGDAILTYGVVDSHNYPNRSSFLRYQYPSELDARVQQRMSAIGARIIGSTGFEHEAFNIEFFYDEGTDHIGVLEVNPRMSQSHGHLYERVDGLPNHKIAADLAVGCNPRPPAGEGQDACAAKFYVRAFDDGVVERVPTDEEIAELEQSVPGAIIEVQVGSGVRLSDTEERDSYSFELAHVYLGADDERELLDRFETIRERLRFDLAASS